jgi:hypothetical protein
MVTGATVALPISCRAQRRPAVAVARQSAAGLAAGAAATAAAGRQQSQGISANRVLRIASLQGPGERFILAGKQRATTPGVARIPRLFLQQLVDDAGRAEHGTAQAVVDAQPAASCGGVSTRIRSEPVWSMSRSAAYRP